MNANWFQLPIILLLISLANAGQSSAADITGDSNGVALFNGKDLTG